jgi:CheY-like chemotaxis protein
MLGAKKILVVDDDQEILALLKSYLEHEKFDVYLASSAREALRLAKHAVPDLVILDVMMPDQGGLTIYKQLKEARGPEMPTPVIVYSAAPSFLILGKPDGPAKADVIAKSENVSEIITAVKSRLGLA